MRKSRTTREIGDEAMHWLKQFGYSGPFGNLEPQWYWMLTYELEKLQAIAEDSGVLVVVTPDMENALQVADDEDTCAGALQKGLLVLVMKKLETTGEFDVADNQEFEELCTLTHEIGENLSENGTFFNLECPVFYDVGMAAENRLFCSCWSFKAN